MGIAQSPEGRRLFPRMTVRENLEMGAFQRNDRAGSLQDIEHVYSLFPRLQERRDQKAGTLSGGEQQMCAIGRALMARPGCCCSTSRRWAWRPILVDKIFEIIQEINSEGTTILLVEQNALIALGIANRGYVLETGKIVAGGQGRGAGDQRQVRKAYLGDQLRRRADRGATDHGAGGAGGAGGGTIPIDGGGAGRGAGATPADIHPPPLHSRDMMRRAGGVLWWIGSGCVLERVTMSTLVATDAEARECRAWPSPDGTVVLAQGRPRAPVVALNGSSMQSCSRRRCTAGWAG